MEATGIVKGTKNLAAAQEAGRLVAISKAANELYGKFYAIVGYPGVEPGAAELSAECRAAMTKIDFGGWARNAARILAEWTKRYDAKSAPK